MEQNESVGRVGRSDAAAVYRVVFVFGMGEISARLPPLCANFAVPRLLYAGNRERAADSRASQAFFAPYPQRNSYYEQIYAVGKQVPRSGDRRDEDAGAAPNRKHAVSRDGERRARKHDRARLAEKRVFLRNRRGRDAPLHHHRYVRQPIQSQKRKVRTR